MNKLNSKTAAKIAAVMTDDISQTVTDIAKQAGLSVATVRKYTDRFTRDELVDLANHGKA